VTHQVHDIGRSLKLNTLISIFSPASQTAGSLAAKRTALTIRFSARCQGGYSGDVSVRNSGKY